MVRKRWQVLPEWSSVVMAGLALIVLGIVGLILSAKIASDWWQGTLQALGVGFIVGGVVDVLAISRLNQIIQSASDKQRGKYKQDAEAIVAAVPPGEVDGYLRVLRDDQKSLDVRAAVLHRVAWQVRITLLQQLDPKLRDQLIPKVYKD